MNKRNGSALLVVIFLIATISTLLMNVNYKLSLLVQTVIQREKQLQYHYAAQACIYYAIHLAKNNWRYMHKRIQSDRLVYADVPWHVTEKVRASATLTFSSIESGFEIIVELYDNVHTLKEKISCVIKGSEEHILEDQIKKVTIHDWKEG